MSRLREILKEQEMLTPHEMCYDVSYKVVNKHNERIFTLGYKAGVKETQQAGYWEKTAAKLDAKLAKALNIIDLVEKSTRNKESGIENIRSIVHNAIEEIVTDE